MAGVYKRESDKARGKAGKWTMWFVGPDGKRKTKAGTTDKGRSLEIARHLEAEATREREGLVSPDEKMQKEAATKPLAGHIEDYRDSLVSKGGTGKHAAHVAGVLARVLDDAEVAGVSDLAVDRIQSALGRVKAERSARTANHALGPVKAFAAWLEATGRVDRAPRGLAILGRYNEESDRRLTRRALDHPELERLLAAAESGGPVCLYGATKSKLNRTEVSGPDRALLYRLAMGTGFRADELRSLTPESFRLDGPEPTITVRAAYTKNGREAVQPITRELAERLKPLISGREPGKPVVTVPEKTAEMLRKDLEAAGIVTPRARRGKAAEGVVDFHALRGSYITHLIRSGANPKVVQMLARHSTVTLTLARYTHLGRDDLRKALEGGD